MVGNFVRNSSSNQSAIHLVSWNNTTLSKTERGLGIKDLRLDKISLMAKNVIHYLNARDASCVDTLKIKYGSFNFLIHKTTAKCSSFFKALWNIANII